MTPLETSHFIYFKESSRQLKKTPLIKPASTQLCVYQERVVGGTRSLLPPSALCLLVLKPQSLLFISFRESSCDCFCVIYGKMEERICSIQRTQYVIYLLHIHSRLFCCLQNSFSQGCHGDLCLPFQHPGQSPLMSQQFIFNPEHAFSTQFT